MTKKHYTALIIVITLVVSVIVLSLSLSALAGTWKNTQAQESQNQKLTAEEAEQIALNETGYTREEVTFKPTEYDVEKGKAVWEVEFYYGNTEYDFEIDAYTGEILKKHQEIEERPTKPTSTTASNPEPTPEPTPTPNPEPTVSTELSEEKALEIVLADAGLTADVISRLKIEKERDDGVWVYEIEFNKGNVEYDYEIRVSDGKILERDIDLD